MPGQQFFVGSFPGVYESEWKAMVGDEGVMSVSCVFFPDGSELSGQHAKPCMCSKLYGPGSSSPHPDFAKWKDGHAP